MNKTKFFKIFVPLALVVGASLWSIRAAQQAGGQVSSRQDSPETILNHVRSLHNHVVLVNFWASWCQPCKEEMPAIRTLGQQYSAKGLKIILVSIDDPGEVEEAAAYLRDNQMDFTTFYKGAQSLKFVTQIFPQWSGAVPASVLMNSDLKILDAWEGDSSLEDLEKRVQKQLRGS